MTDDEIIAGLSAAQQRALQAMRPGKFHTARELRTSGSTMNFLWCGMQEGVQCPEMMVVRDYTDWPRLSYHYRLTDLGIRIRTKLMEDNNAE